MIAITIYSRAGIELWARTFTAAEAEALISQGEAALRAAVTLPDFTGTEHEPVRVVLLQTDRAPEVYC